MTKEEIYKLLVWRNEDKYEANFDCFLPVFNQTVNINIVTEVSGEISAQSVRIINDFFGLDDHHLAAIKGFLWDDCKVCCDSMSWGVDVPEGKTETEANHEDIGVFNGEDAYQKSTFSLGIHESDQEMYKSNYGRLYFDNEWNSHLTTVLMKNGNIVGYGDSGINLGNFEK